MLHHASILLMLAQTVAAVPPPPIDPADRISGDWGSFAVSDSGCRAQPIDAGYRQRLVDAVAAEWARFAFPVADFRTKHRRTLPAVVPKRFNPVRPAISRSLFTIGLMEDDKEVRKTIAGYWAAVPSGPSVIANQNAVFTAYNGKAPWIVPWSAAFMSYLQCAAGAADPAQFARDESHYAYIDQAIATGDGTAAGIYIARDIDDGLPLPGDLLCAGRGSTQYRTVTDRRPDMGNYAELHCDLVVKTVAGKQGYVALIGGNVIQAVTMTLINILPAAGGKPARVETAADPNALGTRPWFTVLQLQAPGSAKLEAAPAIAALARR